MFRDYWENGSDMVWIIEREDREQRNIPMGSLFSGYEISTSGIGDAYLYYNKTTSHVLESFLFGDPAEPQTGKPMSEKSQNTER